MDYEYWMRLDRAGGVLEYLPELLASTRMHPDAKTSGGHDYLTRRFREMFSSSVKHAGYISRTNLHGWIATCVYPRWPILKNFPKTTTEAVTAWFTYRHVANCRWFGAVTRTVEHMATHMLPIPEFSLIEYVRSKFRSRPADTPFCLPYQRWGPHLHNLLGTRVIVGAGVDRGADELRLAGRPLCDLTLSLKIGDEPLAEVPLKARELTDLRVRCPAVKGDQRVITLEFSDSVRCPVRGEYAFELLGTNLFGERYHG
jgi:hypothetical protein